LVDTTTLIVASTITQTIVITITLVIFVLQFRSQEQAIREASYQGLKGRYNDYITEVVQNPALGRMLTGDDGISPDESAIYGNLLVAYGIIEEAFLLRTKKWITEDEWQQWSAFLSALLDRPQMKTLFERSRRTFDPKFGEYTERLYRLMEEDAQKKLQKETK
jgi:hypothetical protein